ncbi:hypothetical protein [Ferviditalea candida]|uniref:DUF58 domain-containing protein n=1 Tax=Ferviditalea candida TaxID=3108399 RepID=A0ABU5ZND7_9BACL|nr:hypothetical protein [Paenibacillaceae bacterium T2]
MTNSFPRRWPLSRFPGKVWLQNFIVPTRRLIYACIFAALIIGAAFPTDIGFYAFWIVNGLLFALSILDLSHYIGRFQKKRSLLILLSDMESYLFEERLAPYLLKMRRSHLFLLLALQDPLLFRWSGSEVCDERSAFIKSIAQKFMLDRKHYIQKMAGFGIPVLDVPADRLAWNAVNYYLELKSREAL